MYRDKQGGGGKHSTLYVFFLFFFFIALFKASEETNMSARYCSEEGLLSLKEAKTLQYTQNGKSSAALL